MEKLYSNGTYSEVRYVNVYSFYDSETDSLVMSHSPVTLDPVTYDEARSFLYKAGILIDETIVAITMRNEEEINEDEQGHLIAEYRVILGYFDLGSGTPEYKEVSTPAKTVDLGPVEE